MLKKIVVFLLLLSSMVVIPPVRVSYANPSHTVRFKATYVSGDLFLRNAYYYLDGGSGNLLGTLTNSGDWTFTASFSSSIRAHVNVNTGTIYYEELYIDGTLVKSGNVGNDGLTYTVSGTPPNFSVSVSPSSASVVRGSTVDYTVSVSWTSGSGSVSLSLSGLPSNVGVGAFSPSSGSGSFTSTLTIGTFQASPTGSYPLTVTGTSGSVSKSASFTLTVNQPSSGSSHTVRFKATYVSGDLFLRNAYYYLDEGSGVLLGTLVDSGDWTFTTSFSSSIRAHVNVNTGTIYYEELYIDGTLVKSGNVGNDGLTYTAGTPIGSLGVYVRNVNDALRPGARVVLYNSAYVKIGEQVTGSDGSVYWSSLANGGYNVEVYYPSPSSLGLEEFWGGDSVSVSGSTTLNFKRHTQWVSNIQVNGQNPGSWPVPVNTGQPVTVSVTIKNEESASKNVRVRLILDRDKASTYDFDQTSPIKSIGSGSTGSFSFSFTPTTSSTYYLYAVAQGEYPAGFLCTDQWNWSSAVIGSQLDISIIGPENNLSSPPPITLKVQVKQNGQPIENAYVNFYYGNGGTGNIGSQQTTDFNGYAVIQNWDPKWDHDVTFNWWAEAIKGVYTGKSDKRSLTLTVLGISAQIVTLTPATGKYTSGDSVTSSLIFKNAGNARWTFYVGYSVIDQNGKSYDVTSTTVILDSGQTSNQVSRTWTVPSSPVVGWYKVVMAVWKESPETNKNQQPLDRREQANSFQVIGHSIYEKSAPYEDSDFGSNQIKNFPLPINTALSNVYANSGVNASTGSGYSTTYSVVWGFGGGIGHAQYSLNDKFIAPVSGDYVIQWQVTWNLEGEVYTIGAMLGDAASRAEARIILAVEDLSTKNAIFTDTQSLFSVADPESYDIVYLGEKVGLVITKDVFLDPKLFPKIGVPYLTEAVWAIEMGSSISKLLIPTKVPPEKYFGTTTYIGKLQGLTAGREYKWIFMVYTSSTAATFAPFTYTAGAYTKVSTTLDKVTVMSPPSDSTPPETNLVTFPEQITSSTDITLSWIGTDDQTPSNALLYQYKLTGYDIDWSETKDTKKEYRGLKEGNYIFEVKAKDLSGNVEPSPAKCYFTISLPYSITVVGQVPAEGRDIELTIQWDGKDVKTRITFSQLTLSHAIVAPQEVGNYTFTRWEKDSNPYSTERNIIISSTGAYTAIYNLMQKVPSGEISAYLDPATQKLSVGRSFKVDVELDPGSYGISGGELYLKFDPSAIQITDVTIGNLLGESPLKAVDDRNNNAGTLIVALARVGKTPVPTNPGTLITVFFKIEGQVGKEYKIEITKIKLSDSNFKDIIGIKTSGCSVSIPTQIPEDINGDNVVDYKDLAILGASYGKSKGDPDFNSAVDINGDGKVDYRDLAILGAKYKKE